MSEVFNGPNGKLAIVTSGVLGIGILLLCAYGMKCDCHPIISCGNMQFAFSKVLI